MKKSHSLLALLLPIALAGCSGGEDGSGSGNGNALTQSPTVSECGGFAQMQAKIDPPMADPATYCDAERLLWAYDAATQSLGLSNTRVVLNCCGDHAITVTEESGTYVINERDAPQASAGGARCKCNCVFDFAVSVEPIPAGSLPIRLVLDVTDSGSPPKVVYEGSLDLSQGSGEIVTSPDSADPWCGSTSP
jgi:hypothetical protein